MEWTKATYNDQYDKWVPWLEDQYLRWFTKDNKVSYTTKQNLDKTKVTGVEQIDTLQDGVHNLAAGQLGQGGLLQPIGDFASKEGINRAERQGKDDDGNHVPGAEVADDAFSCVANGGKAVAGTAASGVKNAGGYLGDVLGSGKGQQKTEEQ